MKKIVILSAGPGLQEIVNIYGHSSEWIPNILSNHNLDYVVKKVYEMDKCNLNDGDAWIITGSKYSVYDNHEWIIKLLNFTEKLIKNNKKILGICFGHQILGKALGANVIKNPLGWELGSYDISLTKTGKESILFDGFSDNETVYESHQDVVMNIPDYFNVLANTEKSIQAFEYNSGIYGVQFHPEFSWDIIKKYVSIRSALGVTVDDPSVPESNHGEAVLHNFIDLI